MPHAGSNGGRRKIAIAGATGRVGSVLAAKLAEDPVDVVALSRDGNAGRLPSHTAVAVVHFDRPSTLSAALQGADRLFLAHGTSDRQVANEIALIDAAVAAGIPHIVKLSAMGPPTRLHPFDWHMQIEAHLATKDVGYTVLRPGSFVSVLARAGASVAGGTWGGTAGEGRVNLIDMRDIADVARLALLDDQFRASPRAYHLTGPSAVSMPDVAATLSQLLGRPVDYTHRTVSQHREVLIASGVGDLHADLLLGLDRLFRDSILAEVTTTYADLTGKSPRSVAAWLADNLALFR